MKVKHIEALTDQDLSILQNGGVGAMPTDTVYGIVTQASNRKSVSRLYQLKNREAKPGTIIASSVSQLVELGVENEALDTAKKYWPGPVSVIVPANDDLEYLHQGLGTLAFRVTNKVELNAVLDITGPLLTSSANMPGMPVANTIQECRDYFGDKLNFYVDGGDLSSREPSNVIELKNGMVHLLRRGKSRA